MNPGPHLNIWPYLLSNIKNYNGDDNFKDVSITMVRRQELKWRKISRDTYQMLKYLKITYSHIPAALHACIVDFVGISQIFFSVQQVA